MVGNVFTLIFILLYKMCKLFFYLILGDSPSAELQDPNSFTIMSYNVLAQKLLEDHKYLYRKHDTRSLAWEFRSKVLLKEIKEANADVSVSQFGKECQLVILLNINCIFLTGFVSSRGSS